MKTTRYFKHTRSRSDRSTIQDLWMEEALKNPLHEERQLDGRYRRWLHIPSEDRYLRIIVLSDGETVHNAFFDRGFRL
jgi:hypothetical protein